MLTVYTKQELTKAIENRTPQILCKGEVAKEFVKKRTRSRIAKISGVALIVGGLVALPFTGGVSAAGIATGAMALTIGTIAISTGDLAIICGTAIALVAILKGAKVTFNSDGSVIVEPNYKN